MELILPGQPLPQRLRGAAIAIGNFDGVHRGHRVLLEAAAAWAGAHAAPWGAVTFEPHPRAFFRPAEPVFRLTPLALKARLIEGLGADFLSVLTFDAALASLSPEDFVEEMLVRRLQIGHAVTGYDFHFGKGRKGSPETMRQLGERSGFTTSVIEQVTDDDGLAPFSSSAIRGALRHGRVDEARHQLGYPWSVMGEVVAGDRRGRAIGFPTINILLDPGAELFQGIYAVRVSDTQGPARWNGAGYFGARPTFGEGRLVLEVFLLDFSGDLYGRTLAVEFIALIRPDRAFATAEDLARQMTADCAEARRVLESPANT